MEWTLYGDLAEVAGDRRVSIDSDGTTAGEALEALLAKRPALADRVRGGDGTLEPQINVLVNGRTLSPETGDLDRTVELDDDLALLPPISGG